jgi:hypothetical protein
MNYWVCKVEPEARNLAVIGKTDRYGSHKKIPKQLTSGDRFFLWASLRIIGLAVVTDPRAGETKSGRQLFQLQYLTGYVGHSPRIKELRRNPMLNEATFLKSGPTGVIPLPLEQAEVLFGILCARNPTLGLEKVWPDLLPISPESEADLDIEQTLQSTIERVAGFQSNPRIRRAIEMYAMDCAQKRLEKMGYKPKDTHKTKSYDFLCNVSGTELFVEVKGTQDDGNSVSLSPKEVDHARTHANSALFIVHSVKVKGKRNPVVSGGEERFVNPWDISTGTLKERGFIYTLSKKP